MTDELTFARWGETGGGWTGWGWRNEVENWFNMHI